MARKKTNTLKNLINRKTGVTTLHNGGRGSFIHKDDKKGTTFINRRQKYRNIRAALGLSTG